MTALTCHLISALPEASLPEWARSGASKLISEFRAQSNGAITLSVLREQAPTLPPGPVCAYDLHRALRVALGAPDQPVRRIGLILADEYAHDIYGLMFDRSFEGAGLQAHGGSLLGDPPREGCAVFLSPIDRERANAADRDRQSLFTAIHEVGHIFNLQHEFYERCYMMQTHRAMRTTYDRTYWRFARYQRAALSRGASDPHVWPGGSGFGVRGSNADGPAGKPGHMSFGITIELRVPRISFAPFEPVEMDIEVALHRDRKATVVLPDIIDPGYTSFQVWIEEPDRQRRLFRSPRRYCWSGKTLEVGLRQPFRRDISLYGEAGGYTFRRAGEHRVWVELHTPGYQPVVSNAVTIDVTAHMYWDEQQAALFQRASLKTLLYHRLDRHRGQAVRSLRDWLSDRHRHPSAPSAGYSLARALLERSRNRALSNGQAREVDRLLARTCDSEVVSINQRRIAGALRARLHAHKGWTRAHA